MRRSAVRGLSLVSLIASFLVAAPLDGSAQTGRLWTDAEFQRGRELSKEFLKTGAPLLKKQKTLHTRPPFYKGPLPLTYSVSEAGMPGLSVTFTMDFGAWCNEFVYLDLDKANYILANGARAIDRKTGRVLAEAKLVEPFIGTPKPVVVEERHFGEDGKLVFRSKSSFEKSDGCTIPSRAWRHVSPGGFPVPSEGAWRAPEAGRGRPGSRRRGVGRERAGAGGAGGPLSFLCPARGADVGEDRAHGDRVLDGGDDAQAAATARGTQSLDQRPRLC